MVKPERPSYGRERRQGGHCWGWGNPEGFTPALQLAPPHRPDRPLEPLRVTDSGVLPRTAVLSRPMLSPLAPPCWPVPLPPFHAAILSRSTLSLPHVAVPTHSVLSQPHTAVLFCLAPSRPPSSPSCLFPLTVPLLLLAPAPPPTPPPPGRGRPAVPRRSGAERSGADRWLAVAVPGWAGCRCRTSIFAPPAAAPPPPPPRPSALRG